MKKALSFAKTATFYTVTGRGIAFDDAWLKTSFNQR
jgi:hypothetical protein